MLRPHILLASLSCLILGGCFFESDSGRRGHRRKLSEVMTTPSHRGSSSTGSLSDAMLGKDGRPRPAEPRPVRRRRSSTVNTTMHVATHIDHHRVHVHHPPEVAVPVRRRGGQVHLCGSFESAWVGGDQFSRLHRGYVEIGGSARDHSAREHHAGGLRIGLGRLEIDDASPINHTIDDPSLVQLGGIYRYYFNDPHTFVSPAVEVDLSFGQMFWDYRHRVYDEYNDLIEGDSLGFFELGCATGVRLGRDDTFGGQLMIGPSVMAFGNYTEGGYENDVFDNVLTLRARLGLVWNF